MLHQTLFERFFPKLVTFYQLTLLLPIKITHFSPKWAISHRLPWFRRRASHSRATHGHFPLSAMPSAKITPDFATVIYNLGRTKPNQNRCAIGLTFPTILIISPTIQIIFRIIQIFFPTTGLIFSTSLRMKRECLTATKKITAQKFPGSNRNQIVLDCFCVNSYLLSNVPKGGIYP